MGLGYHIQSNMFLLHSFTRLDWHSKCATWAKPANWICTGSWSRADSADWAGTSVHTFFFRLLILKLFSHGGGNLEYASFENDDVLGLESSRLTLTQASKAHSIVMALCSKDMLDLNCGV